MSDPYQVTVDDVFNLTGRGTAIVGVHTGGVINSGDRAVLRSNGVETLVPELIVEIHHPPGKIALVLRGVEHGQVEVGAVLSGPAGD